ncbi:E3 ubiquitin ligase BIG BROTHER-related-like [Papaver somniferum]|uniref:E3 ubiquitin ligase BIG BROTHER-related-like n=1 Tax=Papaver somniferum TaxID=3469 RepID=UPI000E6F5F0B|nr:E3 ubiquitin ligase BIG BROTHER-related-like [Papaver somniferum]
MSTQDLNQHRRQREELDSNQTNQRRRVDDESAENDDNNNSPRSSISWENFKRRCLEIDREFEEDAIHDSDTDDDDETVEEESLVSAEEGWDSNSQLDDQNHQGATYLFERVPWVHDAQLVIGNEDGSVVRTIRFDDELLIQLNHNVRSSEDGMSYEELTEMEEMIGKVQRGLSKETISRELKTRVHTTSVDSTVESVICTVCQDGYCNKDKIATLDCQHEYHEDCITQWLLQKNVCPVCKSQALESTMEENKREEVNKC